MSEGQRFTIQNPAIGAAATIHLQREGLARRIELELGPSDRGSVKFGVDNSIPIAFTRGEQVVLTDIVMSFVEDDGDGKPRLVHSSDDIPGA